MSVLEGRLGLRVVRAADGRTVVAEQFFQAPFHLSKPHWDPDAGVLHVQVVNPTAGILAGALGVPVRGVSLVAGANARIKRLKIAGGDQTVEIDIKSGALSADVRAAIAQSGRIVDGAMCEQRLGLHREQPLLLPPPPLARGRLNTRLNI